MFEYASALAGLGLFLSGLHLLSASMKPLAGKRMRILLSKLTGGYISGAFAGTILGALTQSTSGSTFVCMGLVNSGALKLKQALNILAWSSVGGSLLVFLVSIDIRLLGMIFVGLVGIAHLFNADRMDKVKYLVAILFALGMLLLGLGMIKEGAHLLRESQWIRDFIEFASETTTICFIIGLLFTLITQSASTATIIGITLVISGIIPFQAAVILVFGSNVGSGVSLLLITSHLNGVQKQISTYQFLTKLLGVLLLMPIFLALPGLFEPHLQNAVSIATKGEIAFQISIIYLLLQIAGAIIVSIFQLKITSLLDKFFPESEIDGLSKPKFIYHEAVDLTVQLAHGLALGFGGVRGEHGLDADIFKCSEDVGFIEAEGAQLLQIVRPQALFSFRAALFLAQTADLRGGPLLDDIEQLKSNGIGLTEGAVRFLRHPGANPWEAGGQLWLPELLQNGGEGLHEVTQIVFEELKAEVAEVLRRSFRHGWVELGNQSRKDA